MSYACCVAFQKVEKGRLTLKKEFVVLMIDQEDAFAWLLTGQVDRVQVFTFFIPSQADGRIYL